MATLWTSASPSSCFLSPASTDILCNSVARKVSYVRNYRHRTREEQTARGYGMLIMASSQQSQNRGWASTTNEGNLCRWVQNATAAAVFSLSVSLCGVDFALARPESVNRPDLLPKSFTTVIDVAGFLSPQQEGRIAQDVASIEEETGFKLRVLAQNYPETPGLAVKNFWQVDDNTIVFVADPSLGNILNFNVGASVDLNVPRSFWSRLAGKYGNIFFWREKGEDVSIEAAVTAIGECLREPAGPLACSDIK